MFGVVGCLWGKVHAVEAGEIIVNACDRGPVEVNLYDRVFSETRDAGGARVNSRTYCGRIWKQGESVMVRAATHAKKMLAWNRTRVHPTLAARLCQAFVLSS